MARWTCRFTIQTQNLAGIYGEEERAIDPNQAVAPENGPGARRLPVGDGRGDGHRHLQRCSGVAGGVGGWLDRDHRGDLRGGQGGIGVHAGGDTRGRGDDQGDDGCDRPHQRPGPVGRSSRQNQREHHVEGDGLRGVTRRESRARIVSDPES